MEIALLREMQDNGGSVKTEKAILGLKKYFPSLTEGELSVVLKSGDQRWANRVRWARQSLVQKGQLDPSAYGVWSITESGRTRLNQVWPGWQPKYVLESEATLPSE